MEIRTVGVVGAGIMGSGIAQLCAQSGYNIVLSEVNDALLQKGLGSINARLTRDVEKGKISVQDKETIISRIKGTVNITDFSPCDIVIEAVVENIQAKKEVFRKLDEVCPQHTILATNTSVLSVIEISTATKRMDKVLGLHFFNPAPVMKLLEVVKTLITSDETVEICKNFGRSLGKSVVVVKDIPGFIVNRLSIAFDLIAIRMLEQGVATKEDIDSAVKLGLNHPVGPFELADMAGLDTLYNIACDLHAKLNEPVYAPPVLLQKMVAAGWLGRKTGKGFYEYR